MTIQMNMKIYKKSLIQIKFPNKILNKKKNNYKFKKINQIFFNKKIKKFNYN